LDEWASGEYVEKQLNGNVERHVYQEHFTRLQDTISVKLPRRLSKLQKDLFESGRYVHGLFLDHAAHMIPELLVSERISEGSVTTERSQQTISERIYLHRMVNSMIMNDEFR
jgi:hypothetical protein